MSPEEQAERLSAKPGYVFLEVFIYKEHDLFPQYTIPRKEGNITTRYYMIDFRYAFRVNCDKITRKQQDPLGAKRLQLSISTRAELRDKISFYYSRVPEEDLAATS
jgi:hypothetical protein